MDPELWRRLKQIDGRADEIKTLEADFLQLRHTPLLKKPMQSSGRVFVNGGRILWNTNLPYETQMLVTDDELRLFFPDDNLLEIYSLNDRLGELAASPVPQLDLLVGYFRITEIPEQRIDEAALALAVRDGTMIALRLEPRDEDMAGRIISVDVYLRADQAHVSRMEMTDSEGERTVISFVNVSINTLREDDELNIKAPEDVRISRPMNGQSR